ncbi:MAG: prolipoprotein diacylglyceryl transferase [Ignavibacteria bacterium]|nr:MAG: prolipoprotein diacylglyceryl transferase [Ignavibacteria bacterium]KAF0157636.1 MAG: prolipoprotein diacylglyceryl transferase [Ignavibacteria bacterium]
MIYWDVSPDIFSFGPITVRWYGLLFAASFIVGYQIMMVIYNKEDRTEQDLNDLVWYMVAGTVFGARLGHCLFYNPEYYLAHPLEMLMIWKGGLSSHGAAIGILAVLYLYTRTRKGFTLLWIMDRVVITVALAAFFIRMGNLFNSEIIGKTTDVPWAFVFVMIDEQPRHPTQIYEALAYLIVFFLLLTLYFRSQGKVKEGRLLGLFLILIFGFRFFVEFLKENQSQFEAGMILNMGQLLSIPLIILGVFILISKMKKQ